MPLENPFRVALLVVMVLTMTVTIYYRLRAASSGENVMPPILDAVRAYATLGEMCDALRDVWGTWRESPVF